MAVVTVTRGGNFGQIECIKHMEHIGSLSNQLKMNLFRGALNVYTGTDRGRNCSKEHVDCYDNSTLPLYTSWCEKLVESQQKTLLAQVVPQTVPFTNKTLCWCRGNLAEGKYMGLSCCITYVYYVNQSTTDLLTRRGSADSTTGQDSPMPLDTLSFGETSVQAGPINLGPGENGAGTFMNHYWVCGQAVYVSLPKHWFGCCVFVTLNTTMKVFKVNESHKVHKRRDKRSQFFSPNDVPLASRRSSKWDKLGGEFLPWFGVSQNAHEIDKVAYELETLTNLTTEGFQMMQPEMRAIRIMVMQNRMVLDMLL
ncbi:hypothetical protein HHUSO_G19915, partial [Huso huso]